jgi:hypothetical protein
MTSHHKNNGLDWLPAFGHRKVVGWVWASWQGKQASPILYILCFFSGQLNVGLNDGVFPYSIIFKMLTIIEIAYVCLDPAPDQD